MGHRLCPESPSKGPSLEGSALREAGNSLWLQNKGGSLVALLGTGLWSPVAVDLLGLLSQHSVKLPGMVGRWWVVGHRGWRLSCWNIHICLSNQRGEKAAEMSRSFNWTQGFRQYQIYKQRVTQKMKMFFSFETKGQQSISQLQLGSKVFSFPHTHLCALSPFSSFPISSLLLLPGNELGKSLKSYNQLWYLTFM